MTEMEKPLILIVEDVEMNYLYLKVVLSKLPVRIKWVKNGIEAVDYVKEHPEIKIILMDLLMPKMNGYESTAIIKQLNSEITIIIQSALTMPKDLEKAWAAGCDEYLSKPINSVELTELVKKYL